MPKILKSFYSISKEWVDGLRTIGVAAVAVLGVLSVEAEVSIENEAFRLTLSEAGYATSLVCKETGEECLAKGVKMPFCTLTQYRPYDNENFLIHPAKPTTYPANRITREGNRLVVEFDGTADVAYIAMRITPDYVGFVLERLDYKIEDFGIKRKTETDEFALVRLPIARRTHFGEWLNVMWDDRTAVTLLGDAPETRIDAFAREDGAYEFYAGMENRVKLEGCGAVLVAVRKSRLMDVIGTVEHDYGMPNGVETRQKIGTSASFYWTKSISPTNVDRHIAAAKACGLKYLMINYKAFVRTCGHYDFDLTKFPHGLVDVKAVTAKIREAGLIPGLHFHYNKVSTNDAYLVNGTPDPRLHGIRNLLLARPLAADDTTIYLQGNPAGIIVEPVAASKLAKSESARRLVQIGDELIRYRRAVTSPPYRLEGCVRGVFGTKAAAHGTAERFRHINVDDWPIFVRIDQDTDLQDEISARLSALIRECGFRFYHYDGAEDVPVPYWYNVPRAQTRLRRVIGDMQLWARSAAHAQYSWHSITHGAGFDMFPHERLREAVRRYWSTKAFHNNESFTTTDFGSIDVWWPAEMRRYSDGSWHRTTGLQPDHAELVGSKSVAWNGCGGIRIWRDRDLDHPLIDDIFAVMRRWEEVRAAKSVPEDMKLAMRDASREWFIWPFGFDAKHPELVEYRQITSDDERPVRAFSFRRGGKGGIVYWAVGSKTPPELPLSAPGLSVRSDGARRFVEADMDEGDLVDRFKDALKRPADAPKMKPVLTVPHELDCLIESGHIQGACCSEQGVYLSHARGLEKIGWDGKLIKHVDAPSHLGDCAYADGKIYGAFVIRDKKARKDGKRGLVRVWDENLNVLKEAWFDEALDGIVVLGDTVYVGVDRWGKKLHPLCCVKRLDLNLNDLGNTDVDLGYDIAYGVQTMATDGKDLFFGSYGGTSRVSADLKENARIKFRCSEGFGLVPKSVAKSDAKVFFVVHAMGGNMQGWRKDPENNPPRIRLDFFEFKDGNEFRGGKFVDISVAEEAETFTFTKAPGNDGGKYCRFQVPFNADLSACDGFEFDYRISDLQSSGRLVVFAGTSSNESYSMRVDVPTENEWTHVVLRKRDVYDKSTTNGWAKIVRITLRYSVRGEKGFTAQLRNLRPLPTPDPAIAILFAEDAPRGETGTKSRRKFSFAADRLGLGSFYLSDHDLARGIPPNMKMLFLGRQKPIPEAAAMIEKFRAAGGKVVTWRKLPPTLDTDLERLARENMPGAEAAIARRKAELEVIAQTERQAIAKIPNTGRPGERRKISCHVPTGHGSLTNWEENVKLIKACGFNTLSVNLCRGIYAAYKSKVYKPWPGKSGTDMLEVIKAACNRHGIKFVAWRCCWATPDWLTTKEDLEARRAAGRMVVLKNGELLTKGGCPTHPENIRQEVEGLIELAHKGVSGVNLDFIRYPGEGGCFCARCRSLFEKRIGRTVAKWPDDLDSDAELNSQWIDFRADNITYVVKTVGEYIHKNTPGVMVSVSGFDNPVIARTSVGQDWPYWCRQGWVDVAGMMDYRDTLAEYKDLISGQCSIDVGKAKRSTSIGPSCWGNVEQPALLLAQMIQAAREAGFDGWSVFDFDERTAKLLPLLATGPTKPVHGGENAHE